jgi:UDP-2,3-diacylglucosamine hydrolase
MAIFFISDAHLGSSDPGQEKIKVEKLFAFIEMVKAEGEKLFILGDLFDFWFEYGQAIPKQHLKVVCRLASLVDAGVPIHYITGNHDFWLGNFLSDEIGVFIHRDRYDTEEDGLRLHLTHGDGLAPADWKYRVFIRGPLRNRLAIKLYRLVPPDWGIPLARAVSSRSRKYTAEREPKFLEDYDDYARKKLGEGYDGVIIGHVHLPAIKKFDEGVYLNTGDFFNHFSFGKLAHGAITLEFFK